MVQRDTPDHKHDDRKRASGHIPFHIATRDSHMGAGIRLHHTYTVDDSAMDKHHNLLHDTVLHMDVGHTTTVFCKAVHMTILGHCIASFEVVVLHKNKRPELSLDMVDMDLDGRAKDKRDHIQALTVCHSVLRKCAA